MIKGITVTLINRVKSGTDPLGNDTYTTTSTTVENVLAEPTVTADVVDSTGLSGKHLTCTLAIPKGDTNTWEDAEVILFGKRWKTHGAVIEGIEDYMPLDWHKKVQVERFE